jgi:hypothetical protein
MNTLDTILMLVVFVSMILFGSCLVLISRGCADRINKNNE